MEEFSNNMPDAVYRFNYYNENEGLVMNWICKGQYYDNSE